MGWGFLLAQSRRLYNIKLTNPLLLSLLYESREIIILLQVGTCLLNHVSEPSPCKSESVDKNLLFS